MTRKRSSSAPGQRQLRVGEALRHALAEILARGELRDPELAGLKVTVTEVRISPDLRAATAFVVPFGGGDAQALAKALNRASAFFRMRLTDQVELRVAPTIHFAPDLSFDKAERIERLLHDPQVARDLKNGARDLDKEDGPKGKDPKGNNNGA